MISGLGRCIQKIYCTSTDHLGLMHVSHMRGTSAICMCSVKLLCVCLQTVVRHLGFLDILFQVEKEDMSRETWMQGGTGQPNVCIVLFD